MSRPILIRNGSSPSTLAKIPQWHCSTLTNTTSLFSSRSKVYFLPRCWGNGSKEQKRHFHKRVSFFNGSAACIQKRTPSLKSLAGQHVIPRRNASSSSFGRDFPASPPESKFCIYYANHHFTPSQLSALEREIPQNCNVYVVVSEYPLQAPSILRKGHSQMPQSQQIALELFNRQWKLPEDAVLVYMSVIDRRLEIITGRRIEGCLRPAYLSEMQQRYMIPELKKNNMYEGLRAGIIQVVQRLEWWDELDEEERREEASKQDYHYIDARQGLGSQSSGVGGRKGPTVGADRERDAEDLLKQIEDGTEENESKDDRIQFPSLNSKPQITTAAGGGVAGTGRGGSGGGGGDSSDASLFSLNMPSQNSPIGQKLDVESDNRIVLFLIAFFVGTVALFGALIKVMSRPQCPDCGSKDTKKVEDCKNYLDRYAKYEEERQARGMDNDGPQLDVHGSEMIHFEESQLREAFEACLSRLVPGNWREMHLNSVNYHVQHCKACNSNFAVSNRKMFCKYGDCPHCSFRGYKEKGRITESAPNYVHDGVAVVNYQCHVCNYQDSKRVLLPRLQARGGSSFSSGSGGGNSSSGGSSGSGAGSSW